MGSFAQSNTEIIWFNIPVDKMTIMDILNPLNHLINEHEN